MALSGNVTSLHPCPCATLARARGLWHWFIPMNRRLFTLFLLPLLAAFLAVPVAAQEERKTPYWASIATDDARMRKGPSEAMPVMWQYRRENLPIKVIEVYQNWRKIEDPDGTQGWMAARLLSAKRSAIVTGGIRPMRDGPQDDANITYRAESGVVGFITDCANGWCVFNVGGKRGYIREAHIWGAGAP